MKGRRVLGRAVALEGEAKLLEDGRKGEVASLRLDPCSRENAIGAFIDRLGSAGGRDDAPRGRFVTVASVGASCVHACGSWKRGGRKRPPQGLVATHPFNQRASLF